MMQNRKKHFVISGFTLLELLVAMMLMNVIALSLYSSMRTATHAKRTTTAAMKPYRYVVPTFAFLRDDLTCTLKPNGLFAGDFVAEDEQRPGDYSYDTISFYTTSYSPEKVGSASNIIKVEYLLEDDRETGEVVLKRRKTINLLPTSTAETVDEVVCRNILSFDVQVYDGTSWQESWDSSDVEDELPRGVKVTIVLSVGNKYDETRLNIKKHSDNDDENFGEQMFTNVFMLTCAGDGSQSEQG